MKPSVKFWFAVSDCGSGAEARDVEGEEEEHHQKQASAED